MNNLIEYANEKIPYYAILNITRDCNFKCTYCYSNAGHSKEMMNFNICKKCIDLMYKLPNKKVALLFHGGEPLLNKNLIVHAIEYAESLKEKKFYYFMQTNASLIDDSIIDIIKKYNINVGVSIDGGNLEDNKYRIMKDNCNSFSIIIEKLKLLHENDIYVNVLSVITKNNVNGIVDQINTLEKIGVKTFAFNYFLSSGRGAEHLEYQASDEEIYQNSIKLFERIIEINKKKDKKEEYITERNLNYLIKNMVCKRPLYMCMKSPCGAGNSLLSFMPNGDIFPCDDFLAEDELKIGNINDGSLTELTKKIINKESIIFSKIFSRNINSIEECKKCAEKYVCYGGCTSRSYYFYKNLKSVDPLCKYFKKIIPYIKNRIKEEK